MTDEQQEPTPEQDEHARMVWGTGWNWIQAMIKSVQAWNMATGEHADVEVPTWDELDDATQVTFMHLMVQSPVTEIIGSIMAESLRLGRAYKAQMN